MVRLFEPTSHTSRGSGIIFVIKVGQDEQTCQMVGGGSKFRKCEALMMTMTSDDEFTYEAYMSRLRSRC